jgi:hypothetical protein
MACPRRVPSADRDAAHVRIGLEEREEYDDALDDGRLDLGAKELPMLPVPILDAVEAVALVGAIRLPGKDIEGSGGFAGKQVLQLFPPRNQIKVALLVPLETQWRQQSLMFPVLVFPDSDVTGGTESRPHLSQQGLQLPGTDDGTEEIDHREVSIMARSGAHDFVDRDRNRSIGHCLQDQVGRTDR